MEEASAGSPLLGPPRSASPGGQVLTWPPPLARGRAAESPPGLSALRAERIVRPLQQAGPVRRLHEPALRRRSAAPWAAPATPLPSRRPGPFLGPGANADAGVRRPALGGLRREEQQQQPPPRRARSSTPPGARGSPWCRWRAARPLALGRAGLPLAPPRGGHVPRAARLLRAASGWAGLGWLGRASSWRRRRRAALASRPVNQPLPPPMDVT